MADLYALDTSAILTYTDQEDGVVEVTTLLENARFRKCRLEACSISLMEIYYITLRASGEDQAARLVALIKSWPLICYRNPGPLGQVRDSWLCHKSSLLLVSGVRFQVSVRIES